MNKPGWEKRLEAAGELLVSVLLVGIPVSLVAGLVGLTPGQTMVAILVVAVVFWIWYET